MNLTNLEAMRASPWFEALPKETNDSLIRMMSTTKGATQSSTLLVGDALEIPKLPQNPWLRKLSMEDKGKTVNIETDDEEEDL